jgi:hypothetical protein
MRISINKKSVEFKMCMDPLNRQRNKQLPVMYLYWYDTGVKLGFPLQDEGQRGNI